jgi:hypothetical protein
VDVDVEGALLVGRTGWFAVAGDMGMELEVVESDLVEEGKTVTVVADTTVVVRIDPDSMIVIRTI